MEKQKGRVTCNVPTAPAESSWPLECWASCSASAATSTRAARREPRISANGGSFSTWAENVAAGYGNAAGVVDGWMNSRGHRENILNPSMTQIGVAVAIASDGTPYWTMVLSG